MKGIILEFTENSPFHQQTVYIVCEDWSEFEVTLFKQFDSDCNYMQIDYLDSDTHNYDAELRVGGNYYKCNNTVINMEIR